MNETRGLSRMRVILFLGCAASLWALTALAMSGCSATVPATTVATSAEAAASTVAASTSSTTSTSTGGAATAMTQTEAGDPVTMDADGTRYLANQVLIVFRAGVSPADAMALITSTPGLVPREVSADELSQAVPIVTVRLTDGHTPQEEITVLEQSPLVESAQLNHVYATLGVQ